MPKKAGSEEQILRALHEAERGERIAGICREHGVSEATRKNLVIRGAKSAKSFAPMVRIGWDRIWKDHRSYN